MNTAAAEPGSVKACLAQKFPVLLLSPHRLEGELNAVKQKRAAVQSTLRRSHKEQVQPSQQGTSAAQPSPLHSKPVHLP